MEYNISNKISDIKTIAERIDYIRRQNDLNQEQLAARLDISQPAVSKYLKERIPPADILLKLATLGGTTMEWILTGQKKHFFAEEGLRVKDTESAYMLDTDIQLAYKIARLKPKARQTLKNLIDIVYKEDQ
jgi:transcriptional regulator with XRE-family HTH domain